MLVDTHCHLQFKSFDTDRDEVIARTLEKDVVMNLVGSQFDTSAAAVQLADRHKNTYATIGLHPIQEYVVPVQEETTSFVSRGEEFDPAVYENLIQNSKKVIAIGETGLDKFHIPKNMTGEQIFEHQKKVFLQHYELAQKYNLPLVIHVRDAHAEMAAVINELPKPVKGVVHCFSGGPKDAQPYLDAGLYLGFTGIITFPAKKTDPKQQEDLWEVIRNTPQDKILIETDAPYLAPQAHRGKRCEPWMVEECAKKIAELRGVSYQEMAEITNQNAVKLFGITI